MQGMQGLGWGGRGGGLLPRMVEPGVYGGVGMPGVVGGGGRAVGILGLPSQMGEGCVCARALAHVYACSYGMLISAYLCCRLHVSPK